MFLYLPILLFISLRTEADQLHLWLHNPQSAAALLLSKILNGLIMMVVSLVVLYSMAGLLIISRFSLIEAHWTDTWTAGCVDFPSYDYDFRDDWRLGDPLMVPIPCA